MLSEMPSRRDSGGASCFVVGLSEMPSRWDSIDSLQPSPNLSEMPSRWDSELTINGLSG